MITGLKPTLCTITVFALSIVLSVKNHALPLSLMWVLRSAILVKGSNMLPKRKHSSKEVSGAAIIGVSVVYGAGVGFILGYLCKAFLG